MGNFNNGAKGLKRGNIGFRNLASGLAQLGYLFGGFYKTEYSILVSILSYSGNLPYVGLTQNNPCAILTKDTQNPSEIRIDPKP